MPKTEQQSQPIGHNAAAKRTPQVELRQQNMRALLRVIQMQRAISQAGLARQTGLSPASVSSILQPLLAQELLVESGKSYQLGAGRRGALLGFNDQKALVAGVVVDQAQCEVALLGLAANVIAHATTGNPDYHDPEKTSALIAATLDGLLDSTPFPAASLVGIGVAMPGMIDPEAGIVRAAANLGWRDVPFRSLLARRVQPPVTLEHLGRAKAIAETLWGGGIGCANLVCVEIGSGIGAGVLVGGHLLKGGNGAASEIGHVALDVHGPRCTCGLTGCWESYCAGPAIRKRIGQHLAAMPQIPSTLTPASSLAELERAVQAGDLVAQVVMAETANYMARGLLNVIWSFDPSLIILSGFVVQECPTLIDFCRVALHKSEVIRPVDIPIAATTQGADAGVIAASVLAAAPYLDSITST